MISLSAISQQEATAIFKQSQKQVVQTLMQRTDYTNMFVNYYPYTLMMYYLSKEIHYTRMQQYSWNAITEEWIMLSDMILEYDGDLPTTITQTMTVNEQEITMVYSFTHTGTQVTGLVMSWDAMGYMMEYIRETYTFSGDQWVHLLAEANQIVNWVNEYQYDVTEVIEQNWDNEYWMDEYRETWQWSGDVPSHYMSEYFDGDNWYNEEQSSFTYSGDILTEEFGQFWDGSVWVNDYLVNYEWNGTMPSRHTEMEWDGIEWVNDQLVTYYEEDGELSSVISQDWNGDREWVNSGKYVYSYGVANDENDIPPVTTAVNVYPNPFNPVTNIQYTVSSDSNVRIDIYNVRGQKVETLVDEHKSALRDLRSQVD